MLQWAAALFANTVITPAVTGGSGELRICSLFDGWFKYAAHKQLPGGDIFTAAASELDDNPGVRRYYVARVQRDWIGTLENATREAMGEGQFRPDLDPGQIAFNIISILQACHMVHRLLNVPNAELRARLVRIADGPPPRARPQCSRGRRPRCCCRRACGGRSRAGARYKLKQARWSARSSVVFCRVPPRLEFSTVW